MASSKKSKAPAGGNLVVNRKATHDYTVLEKFEAGKRRVVLLGDETASAAAADYADAQVFDFGFAGFSSRDTALPSASNSTTP